MIGVKCEMGLAEENRSEKIRTEEKRSENRSERLQGQGELDEQVLTWWFQELRRTVG